MFKPLAISLAIAAAFPAFVHAAEEMLRVNVTGSNIRVSEKEGASTVQVITAKELKAGGKTSVSAVQRLEVLKDGASSVYGSDAVAGVVNIILYQEFTGMDITAQWDGSPQGTGQHEKSAALQTGFGKLEEDGYSVVFSVDAQQRDKLQQSDVAWLRDADHRQQQRGSLGWTATNYAGNDPTQTLGGVRPAATGAVQEHQSRA